MFIFLFSLDNIRLAKIFFSMKHAKFPIAFSCCIHVKFKLLVNPLWRDF